MKPFRLILVVIVAFISVGLCAESVKYGYIDCSDCRLLNSAMEKVIKEDMLLGTDRYFTLTGRATPRMVKITVEARDMSGFRPHHDDVGYTMYEDRLFVVRNNETLHTLGLSVADSVSRSISYGNNQAGEGNPKEWILVYKDDKIILEWYDNKPVARLDSIRPRPQELTIDLIADPPMHDEWLEKMEKKYQKRKCYSLLQVDEEPSFPGGNDALLQWVKDNFVYPEDAREQGLKGFMHLMFVINADGDAVWPEGSKDLIKPCFWEEIERLMSIMPKWTPGKINGEPVDVSRVLNWRYPVEKNP